MQDRRTLWATPFLGINPLEILSHVPKGSCTKLFTKVLFVKKKTIRIYINKDFDELSAIDSASTSFVYTLS